MKSYGKRKRKLLLTHRNQPIAIAVLPKKHPKLYGSKRLAKEFWVFVLGEMLI